MTAKIYYATMPTVDLKDKTIAFGLCSQGHGTSSELARQRLQRDHGQPRWRNYDLAKSHKFEPMSVEDAVKKADVVNILLPDEVQGDIYRNCVKPNLKPKRYSDVLARFQHSLWPGSSRPKASDICWSLPRAGHLVRSEFFKGGGVLR